MSAATCTRCGGRVGTILRGEPLCYPCGTAATIDHAVVDADEHERAARYDRPWLLPRGVAEAEAAYCTRCGQLACRCDAHQGCTSCTTCGAGRPAASTRTGARP